MSNVPDNNLTEKDTRGWAQWALHGVTGIGKGGPKTTKKRRDVRGQYLIAEPGKLWPAGPAYKQLEQSEQLQNSLEAIIQTDNISTPVAEDLLRDKVQRTFERDGLADRGNELRTIFDSIQNDIATINTDATDADADEDETRNRRQRLRDEIWETQGGVKRREIISALNTVQSEAAWNIKTKKDTKSITQEAAELRVMAQGELNSYTSNGTKILDFLTRVDVLEKRMDNALKKPDQFSDHHELHEVSGSLGRQYKAYKQQVTDLAGSLSSSKGAGNGFWSKTARGKAIIADAVKLKDLASECIGRDKTGGGHNPHTIDVRRLDELLTANQKLSANMRDIIDQYDDNEADAEYTAETYRYQISYWARNKILHLLAGTAITTGALYGAKVGVEAGVSAAYNKIFPPAASATEDPATDPSTEKEKPPVRPPVSPTILDQIQESTYDLGFNTKLEKNGNSMTFKFPQNTNYNNDGTNSDFAVWIGKPNEQLQKIDLTKNNDGTFSHNIANGHTGEVSVVIFHHDGSDWLKSNEITAK